MKTIKNLNFIWVVLFIFNLPATIGSSTTSNLYAQDPILLENSWFVQESKDGSANTFFNTILNINPELRFEITFLSDKIVLEGCCGGEFEVEVNYIGNDSLQILSLTEYETISCDSSFVSNFYTSIKGAFNSLLGNTVTYQITSYAQILYLNINHQSNSRFVNLTNIPLEDTDHSTSPYWGHEPPIHQWSLTHVQYQGQMMELPYGAALTFADVYEGTFSISLCGEIFVALNSSWYLDVENYEGPCFISCGILENTVDACVQVAGYDTAYLEIFKQNAYNFLNDNVAPTINPWETMQYEFDFGTSSHNARKLIIYDFSQNKLIFHSTENFLNIVDTPLPSTINVYPNPVQETLHINQNRYHYVAATIYDLQGKNLGQHSLENSKSSIDVKSFVSGLYFLVLESEKGERVTQKLVKK